MKTAIIKPDEGVIQHNHIDRLEAMMHRHVQTGDFVLADCQLVHRFTPGLYIREIHIPEGTLLTTIKHKLEHPFVLSAGVCKVTSPEEGSNILTSPHTGITPPGTRRAIHAITDIVWTTFHVTDKTDIDEIIADITYPHDNPLLPDGVTLCQWKEANPKISVQ